MRAAWLEVNTEAYKENFRAMTRFAGTPALAVVKANGYGHGLVEISRAAVEAGAVALGVALPEEGAVLREAGIEARIVVLAPILPDQAEETVGLDLEPVVSQPEVLDALSRAAIRRETQAAVHVKVDTGMTRVGAEPARAVELIHSIRRDPALRLAGVMTHFATVDADEMESIRVQLASFHSVLEQAEIQPGGAVGRHAAASAAALCFPDSRLDYFRAGLVAYGAYPSLRPFPPDVSPVLSLRASVAQLRRVPAGREVGYGGTWTTPRPTTLALIPLGYADGTPYSLSNRGVALIRGRRAQIRGRVCMDQILLDVTDIAGAALGDRVTLIGADGADRIRVEEMAMAARTTPYEVLTRLSTRLPRLYVSEDSP